jgi:Arc/MetJ family transcription regulator
MVNIMRTTVEIDDKLWEEVQHLTGIHMKRRLIESVFREYLQMKRRRELSKLIGNYKSFGLELEDLEEMRSAGSYSAPGMEFSDGHS